MNDSISNRVIEVIKDVLNVASIDRKDLDDLGWDSLRHLDIILAIEQEFRINIPIDKIEFFFHSIDNIYLEIQSGVFEPPQLLQIGRE